MADLVAVLCLVGLRCECMSANPATIVPLMKRRGRALGNLRRMTLASRAARLDVRIDVRRSEQLYAPLDSLLTPVCPPNRLHWTFDISENRACSARICSIGSTRWSTLARASAANAIARTDGVSCAAAADTASVSAHGPSPALRTAWSAKCSASLIRPGVGRHCCRYPSCKSTSPSHRFR